MMGTLLDEFGFVVLTRCRLGGSIVRSIRFMSEGIHGGFQGQIARVVRVMVLLKHGLNRQLSIANKVI